MRGALNKRPLKIFMGGAKMTRIFGILGLFVLVLNLAACSSTENRSTASDDDAQKIRSTHDLRVGG